jgi:prolyl-tRNA synthetase
VRLDDRDLRGGEKKWQWVKRGVPLRVEVGPRDVASGSVFAATRLMEKGVGVERAKFIADAPKMLAEMQQQLFDRAKKARDEASVVINTLADFEAFFAENQPGGLAYAHFTDGPEMEAKCKELKVTPRCVPLEPLMGDDGPGECLFTGGRSERRAVFARAY